MVLFQYLYQVTLTVRKIKVNKRERATLALWDFLGRYDLGKSNNDVVRNMYSLAYVVLMVDMTYINLADYSAKFIKLLTKFSNEFNQEDELRLINTTGSDEIYVFITKSALIEFSCYLLIRKNFIKKWAYVEDTLSKTSNN